MLQEVVRRGIAFTGFPIRSGLGILRGATSGIRL